jgi:preprotein translocase subunit SecE
MRRAQQRAERRQQRQTPQRSLPQMAATSAPGEAPRKGSFFRPRWALDIISELRKVTWPTRKEVANLTFVVIVVSVLLGAFLGAADLAFGWLVEQVLLQ